MNHLEHLTRPIRQKEITGREKCATSAWSKIWKNVRAGRNTIHALLSFVLICAIGCKKDPSMLAEEDYARAQEYLKENKPEAAMIELERAIQLKPELAKAHHELAKLYFERG